MCNNEESLYFHNNPNLVHFLLPEAILLESIGVNFVIYQNMVAGTEINDAFDVLNWFQIQQMKFPVLTRFAYIIHSITRSKTENERDFSLVGIYTESRHVNISIEMLSDLFFVYRNSAALGCNTTIGVFEGLLDYVALAYFLDRKK